jgi:hypothetical protein
LIASIQRQGPIQAFSDGFPNTLLPVYPLDIIGFNQVGWGQCTNAVAKMTQKFLTE